MPPLSISFEEIDQLMHTVYESIAGNIQPKQQFERYVKAVADFLFPVPCVSCEKTFLVIINSIRIVRIVINSFD